MIPGNVARLYHDETAHSAASVRSSRHTLDWDIKPFAFKVYTDVPAVPLPRDLEPLDVPVISAPAAGGEAGPMSLGTLTSLLYYSAGVTKKKAYPGGGEMLFRAAASTGALYQTEVYVAAGEVAGLAPGLYHFCPGDFTLRRLRDGDVRGALAAAAAEPAVARRAVTLVLTAIFWRNTWKYQARGFRHLYWDSGTMLANMMATGHALAQAPRLLAGFVDAEINHLLGVDAEREAGLELLLLGREGAPAPAVDVPAIDHATMPLSAQEVDYPLLRRMQEASSLDTAAAVGAWRAAVTSPPRATPATVVSLPPPVAGGRGLGETIQRRGSSRRFTREPITTAQLATALWAATRPLNADVPGGLVDLYLIVSAVEGIAPGAYAYHAPPHALESLAPGDFRRQAAYLCLEQPLAGDAAAVIFFAASLHDVLATAGDRGYRVVNMEAGIAGGRAYLAAYAHGFGASGLTFYDADVIEFFSPHAAGKDALFVTALGRGTTAAGDMLRSTAIQPMATTPPPRRP
ncbi:MAG: SagB family peptide dehydrogenase [Candidatus Rokuibacteriota bacterium]